MNSNLQVTLGRLYGLQGYSRDLTVGIQQNGADILEMAQGTSDQGSVDQEDVNNVLDEVFQGMDRLTMDD